MAPLLPVVKRGTLKINSEVEIVGIAIEDHRYRYRDVLSSSVKHGQAGMVCCCAVTNVTIFERIRVVVGSITPPSSGQAYILSKDEGWPSQPLLLNYRPQFYFRTTDVTGVITLPEAPRWLCPVTTPRLTVT